jgi:predicted esterase
VTERIIKAAVRGRYLSIPATTPGPAPLLLGFHGYAEDAEAQLDRLRSIPGSDRWLTVSIQALHRFYQRRTDRVVASWMTRQDRELAIADNLEYVGNCIDAISSEWAALPRIVFAGFSQGVGMAFRAAANASGRDASVIATGGDIPPELSPAALSRLSAVLIARGKSDTWYKEAQFSADRQRLAEAGVPVQTIEFEGGHEWSGDLIATAADFLGKHAGQTRDVSLTT